MPYTWAKTSDHSSNTHRNGKHSNIGMNLLKIGFDSSTRSVAIDSEHDLVDNIEACSNACCQSHGFRRWYCNIDRQFCTMCNLCNRCMPAGDGQKVYESSAFLTVQIARFTNHLTQNTLKTRSTNPQNRCFGNIKYHIGILFTIALQQINIQIVYADTLDIPSFSCKSHCDE